MGSGAVQRATLIEQLDAQDSCKGHASRRVGGRLLRNSERSQAQHFRRNVDLDLLGLRKR